MADSAVFSGRLLKGEKLVWSGRPAGGVLLTSRDVFLIPFSLFWCGFAIFWTIAASSAGAFALIGVAFVTFGLFFFIGRFFLDAWLRLGVWYGITDRRVLILRTRPSINFTAIDLARLPQCEISERADGRGTIRFGPPTNIFARGGTGFSVWTPSLDPTPQFLAIPEARKVFDLIQRNASPNP